MRRRYIKAVPNKAAMREEIMNNLFDMLNAMNGQASAATGSIPEQLARQFGLQQEQAQKAMEALMPAFSQGLKRNASTPQGFAGFMEAMASGQHNQYTQNPMKAFTPEGMAEGNAILGHLFGGKEVSRAVAAQAEAASGVSQAIIKQMLPAIAPIIMGGLFSQMTNQATQAQAQHFGGGAGGGFLGQILEQMMKGGFGGGMPGGQPPRSQPGGRARNPLEEILEQMTKGGFGGGGGQPQGGGSSSHGGPLGDIFNEMLKNGPMGGGMGGGYNSPQMDQQPQEPSQPRQPDLNDIFGREAPSEPEAHREPQSPYPKGTGLEDLFGDLFKPTSRGAPDYEKAIESIFDQFLPRH